MAVIDITGPVDCLIFFLVSASMLIAEWPPLERLKSKSLKNRTLPRLKHVCLYVAVPFYLFKLLLSFRTQQDRTRCVLTKDRSRGLWGTLAPSAPEREGMRCSLMDSGEKKAYDPIWVRPAKLFPITQSLSFIAVVSLPTINVPKSSLAKLAAERGICCF